MISAYVKGLGFWSPGYENLEAWKKDDRQDGVKMPRCRIVDSRLGRGTSRVTRMAVECGQQAAEHAGFDLSQIGSVFGSCYGELDIAIEQLDMMLEGDGVVSPARFKNSVHNTATGVLSIATKNRGFTTAIAAGDHTLAMTLLEAMLTLESGLVKEAVAIVADDSPREPLRSARKEADFEPVGAALALTLSPEGALAKLTLLPGVEGERFSLPEAFRENPCAPVIGLVEALDRRSTGAFVLSEPPAQAWSVKLQ